MIRKVWMKCPYLVFRPNRTHCSDKARQNHTCVANQCSSVLHTCCKPPHSSFFFSFFLIKKKTQNLAKSATCSPENITLCMGLVAHMRSSSVSKRSWALFSAT